MIVWWCLFQFLAVVPDFDKSFLDNVFKSFIGEKAGSEVNEISIITTENF